MSEKKKETVCAVVVTYNRKNLLIECLSAIRKQTRPVDAIYIIDNASTDETPELLLEKGYIKELPPKNLTEPWEKTFEVKNLTDGKPIKLHYVRMHENTGGAGGFHEGVKRAYERRYDWLWLMDDDGLPKEDCLDQILLASLEFSLDAIQPVVISKEDKNRLAFLIYDVETKTEKFTFLEAKEKAVYMNYATLFNGILIKREVIKKTGPPKKELFIWGDEVEYLLRLKRNKIRIATVTNAVFVHPMTRMKSFNFLGKIKFVFQNDKFKDYCFYRNRTYIHKIYNRKKLGLYFLKYIFYFLFRFNYSNLILFLKAFKDGLLEDWGKEKS